MPSSWELRRSFVEPIPDLHGNVVGQLNSSGSSVTDAFRNDAYCLTEGTILAGSITARILHWWVVRPAGPGAEGGGLE